jgi:thiamine-phosphate pyrophosphorylase
VTGSSAPATEPPAGDPPRLLVISDRSILGLQETVELMDRLFDAAAPGSVGVYFREPGLSDRESFDVVSRLVRAATARGRRAAVYVRGRVDLARAAGAHGVQLQYGGLDPSEARAAGPRLRIGYSAHHIDEVARLAARVDHFMFSPVFASPGKGTPTGLEVLGEASRTAGATPVLALGGIDGPARARAAREHGAWGVAAIRGVLAAADPVAAARELLAAVEPVI